MRRRSMVVHACLFVAVLLALIVGSSWAQGAARQGWDPGRGILIEGATVVTMDDAHDVIPDGRVLVRDGRIVAVWQGPKPPQGVDIGAASVVDAGPQELLFP